jgi:hypothetical protein
MVKRKRRKLCGAFVFCPWQLLVRVKQKSAVVVFHAGPDIVENRRKGASLHASSISSITGSSLVLFPAADTLKYFSNTSPNKAPQAKPTDISIAPAKRQF